MEKIIRIDDHSGLVLEGGGMRGVFTCGVLDSFMDRGIRFPYTIGVSAGACNVPSTAISTCWKNTITSD